jgi:hypothetical protein
MSISTEESPRRARRPLKSGSRTWQGRTQQIYGLRPTGNVIVDRAELAIATHPTREENEHGSGKNCPPAATPSLTFGSGITAEQESHHQEIEDQQSDFRKKGQQKKPDAIASISLNKHLQ